MSTHLVFAVLHVLAALVWLGHMFFWSLVVGPLVKRFSPPERAEALRRASARYGATGAPALVVLVFTGPLLLLGSEDVPPALYPKLVLVAGMILYQVFVGHRPAPRLIYADMLAALGVLALSVWLVGVP